VIQVLSGPSLGEVQDDSEVMFALPWDGIAVEQTNPENVSFVISLVPASPGGTVGPISAITVTIVRQARAVAPPEDDTDKPRKETEEQRQQRERTNRGGKDDVYTEGNVTATSCDASPPAVTIANRDGPVTVRLLQEAAKACGSIRVGDYLEADGEKVHEQLFEATDVSVKHPRR
jgi:hypothetical protein